MSTPEVFVHADGDLLAKAAAARIVTRTADAISAGGHAHLVLTGGGIGTKVLAALAAEPAAAAVDWSKVDFWWGDERFAPTGDPDRNETGARAALLDHIAADPARVHPMAGPDGPDGDDPEASAVRYAAELAAAAGPRVADAATSRKRVELQMDSLQKEIATFDTQARDALGKGREDLARAALQNKGQLQSQYADLEGQFAQLQEQEHGAGYPVFDVVMLGIGPEGHVASLFPGLPAVHDERPVVAVRNSPKPPPTRISLTFGPIQAAREVWILASGAEKAEAVARALAGEPEDKLPAAGARGTARTLFLLDEAAASDLP